MLVVPPGLCDNAATVSDTSIWTEADLIDFTRNANDSIRAWAWSRLALLHPEAASREVPRGLAEGNAAMAGAIVTAFERCETPEGRAALLALSSRRDLPRVVADRLKVIRGDAPGRTGALDGDARGELERGRRRGCSHEEYEGGPAEAPLELVDAGDDDPASIALAAAPDLRERAEKMLSGGSPSERVRALFALGRQSSWWATDLVLAHLDTLLEAEAELPVWDTLSALGDPRALPAVIAEWRPGERIIAITASDLYHLGRTTEPLPDGIRRDVEEARRMHAGLMTRLKDFRGGALPDMGPLELALRCTHCRRTYLYPVGQPIIHPNRAACEREGWDGVTLSRIIICKRCGAEDAYTLTGRAQMTLISAMVMESGRPKSERGSGSVAIGLAQLWDGTQSRRGSLSLQHLRALAEQSPAGGEAWRRLGNLAEKYDRMDEAVEAWHRAVSDKDELEACYSLLRYYVGQADPQNALHLAGLTIAHLCGTQSTEALRRTAAENALEVLRDALPHVREPVALMATWQAEPTTGSKEVVVNVSSIDLRSVERWDRLVDFLASQAFIAGRLTDELPRDRPTQLEVLLNEGGRMQPDVRSRPKVGRNDPCPCGSGKKYKKCCGH